jgi:hypothetical protein
LADAERHHRAIGKAVPLVLGSVCFLGVLLGQAKAYLNLNNISAANFPAFTGSGALDLVLLSQFYIALEIQGIAIVFALYLIFRSVEAPDGVIAAKYFGWAALSTVAITLAWHLVSSDAVALFNEAKKYGHKTDTGQLLDALPMGIGTYVHYFLPALFFLLMLGLVLLGSRLTGYPTKQIGGRSFTIVLTVLAAGFFVIDPLMIANMQLERAALVPLLLGVWVPVLTWLAWASHRTKVPILLLLLLLPLAWAFVRGDNYDVRRLRVEEAGSTVRQIDIVDAVQSWKAANGCAQAGAQCPRPIVVAASGGASRAAFYTASVLGSLMDLSRAGGGLGPHPNAPRPMDFRDRLFAVSAVSGSSLGAAMFAAALADSDRATGNPPCDSHANQSLWWRQNADRAADAGADKAGKAARKAALATSWKDCLQLLLTGDFLSPVFVGLVFSDATRLMPYGDRGRILEGAWSGWYEDIRARDRQTPGRPTGKTGLDAAFTSLAPTREVWRPALVFNSTSAETGQRILVSHLKPSYCIDGSDPIKAVPAHCSGPSTPASTQPSKRSEWWMFIDSHDLYRLFDGDGQTAKRQGWFAALQGNPEGACGKHADACDIRLSSAALLSARFPVVSPHANIRNRSGDIVDRAVDGGYFENFGAATAQEIVETLRRFGLDPFVLLITNDPLMDSNLPCLEGAGSSTKPTTPSARSAELFTEMRAPITALYQTGSARGALAAVTLCQTANQSTTTSRPQPHPRPTFSPPTTGSTERACEGTHSQSFAHIRIAHVRKQNTAQASVQTLSASWWASKPVQMHLDYQLTVPVNECALRKVAMALRE